ncbi:BLUF domain-containing protein [Altibacter sp.]|uniref:BLUF domain-containing protein n=1 Tax=Altibacter sp. TaxID=2024823 RepID=UPI00258B8FE0|nr:BLUF domain-containing protein [Altibacter sp.]MCW8980052.1 BLUF domain-containing protein [Altibacter sp.]MCW9036302.1 BLUF domain-containing protein [Altibacter sp.]
MNHTICYVSKARQGLSEKEIEVIFEKTQRNNTNANITGILLYGFGNFFQVLEGEKEQITVLFDTICEDHRHDRIETLIHHPIKKPIFATYNSKFNVVKTQKELSEIKNYLDVFNNKTSFSSKINRLIHPFLLSI